jgi:hypothetical protein
MTFRSSESSKTEYTDLEIRVFPRQQQEQGKSIYPVEVTFGGQQEFPRGEMPAEIANWVSTGDPQQDGTGLFTALFSDPQLFAAWSQARGQAEKRRIRLRIDPAAAELHALPWELLADERGLLSAGADTPFSRYLSVALPWGGMVQERPIRILVVISNPRDLEEKKLARVNLKDERKAFEALEASLGRDVQIDYLQEGVTLEALELALRREYHVLHYIGHGAFSRTLNQAALLLEDDAGNTSIVTDGQLSGMLVHLAARPKLVFLVACQSAARSTTDAFRGLGPSLVAAGVPAVVAMQDNVSILSARKLSEVFYSRLENHGLVDCAFNEARATLLTAGRPDAAVPVLFMRLKSGQLWSAESDSRGAVLGASANPRIFWSSLLRNLKQDRVVPILGPRVHGQWLPTSAEVARRWSVQHGYPYKNSDDLARVALYLATSQGDDFPRFEYLDTLMAEFTARLPEELRPKKPAKTLSELVQTACWKDLAASNPNEIHTVMAQLGLPLYLTTNVDNLLTEGLKAAGREPIREMCRWNDGLEGLPSLLGESLLTDESYEFNEQAPVVFHLFGTDEVPESLVLSEDQYFRYLYNVAAVYDRIPSGIRARLASSAMMFVGFSLYDWEFRVVMHGLVRNLQNRFKIRHVAVQLEDEEVSGADVEAVQVFLEQYFSGADINVYWGSTAQFVAELREYWEASA